MPKGVRAGTAFVCLRPSEKPVFGFSDGLFVYGLGVVDIQLAKRFFEEKFADARKKAQQDWTSCEHF
ncbi:hypothetical protein [Neisseria sp. KEM232]|uniref:hypothetical protein n=1 Tax=Neisseria sp. KEM232 TaxID=655307 RepID=UPI0018DFCED4|nr:hypothetical protein [Neisseria sp. KEM232]